MCVACEEKRELEQEVERLRAQINHYKEGWTAWRDEEERLRDEIAWLRANDEDHQP